MYEIVNASLQNVTLVNLGGLHIGDRTKADQRLKFVPRPTNIRAIPSFDQVGVGGLHSGPVAGIPARRTAACTKQHCCALMHGTS